jgi:hypothetical protein
MTPPSSPRAGEHRPVKRIRARQTEERCLIDGEFWPCRAVQSSRAGEAEGGVRPEPKWWPHEAVMALRSAYRTRNTVNGKTFDEILEAALARAYKRGYEAAKKEEPHSMFRAALASPEPDPPDHVTDEDDPLACWCDPYRDSEEPIVIIHRKQGEA